MLEGIHSRPRFAALTVGTGTAFGIRPVCFELSAGRHFSTLLKTSKTKGGHPSSEPGWLRELKQVGKSVGTVMQINARSLLL